MRSLWTPLQSLLTGMLVASQATAFVVSIDRPTFLEPALGEIEVVARVESIESVRSVALFVDGRPEASMGIAVADVNRDVLRGRAAVHANPFSRIARP